MKINFKENKSIIKNIFTMFFIQGISFIAPFFTFVYLAKVVGPEKLGLLGFSTAFITYFMIFIDFGFSYTATQQISINRNNKDKMSEIFYSVIIIKSILLFIAFIVFLIVISFFSKFKIDHSFYLSMFLVIIGNALFPIWFFQGIEKMNFILIFNTIPKVIVTVLVLIFIKNQDDFSLYPLINGYMLILSGIISIIFIILNFKLNKFSIKFKNIFDNFKLGINNFVTTMAITLYTISNSFILGIVTNNTIVGYYTFSENFINVLKSLTSPIIQSLYPNMSKKMHENEIDGIKSINKITPFLLLGNVIIFIMVFIFSNFITLFFGDKYKESINILRILALTPIFVCLSSSFAVLGLMNLKKSGIVARIAVIGGVIGIISTIILTILYKHYGTAISAVLAEVVISGLGFYYFRKYEKKIEDKNKLINK